jgi:uncharacterized protein YwgA
MPRNLKDKLDELTNVQKLVHLAMRWDSQRQDAIRAELVKMQRRAYEEELTIQAGRVGCAKQQGRLTAGPILTAINEESEQDAALITNTYNWELAATIQRISRETPRANRFTYAKRLSEWDTARNKFKAKQIAQYTEGKARHRAQVDFIERNDIDGVAVLIPFEAYEPICRGLVGRGGIPIKEAMGIPMPVHINCPHSWRLHLAPVPKSECSELWLGD